jgi:hypothetical protein
MVGRSEGIMDARGAGFARNHLRMFDGLFRTNGAKPILAGLKITSNLFGDFWRLKEPTVLDDTGGTFDASSTCEFQQCLRTLADLKGARGLSGVYSLQEI